MCSEESSSSEEEQGEVPGLSNLMAAALKVVSAPNAFLQTEKPFQPSLLPSFSFSKRGTLRKVLSRKPSISRQQSAASAAETIGRGMMPKDSISTQQSNVSAAAVMPPQEGTLHQQPTTGPLASISEEEPMLLVKLYICVKLYMVLLLSGHNYRLLILHRHMYDQ